MNELTSEQQAIKELTKALYDSYKKIKLLSDENHELRKKLDEKALKYEI